MANTKITNPELFNLGDSTLATQLPVMTTTQRAAMNPPPSLTVDYLVVAGGGGGGGGTGFATNANVGAGGGGAGGLLTSTAAALTYEATYTINIGDGGGGGTWAGSGNSIAGTSGSNSLITGTGINALAYGGGGGGSGLGNYQNAGLLGLPGGSGGGSGFMSLIGQGGAGTVGQGNNGGYSGGGSNDGSGGGGGAGAVGSNGTFQGTAPYYYPGGAGGAGVQNSITGVSPTPYYAGGGGGGSLYNSPTYQGAGGDGGSAIGGSGGRSSTNSSYSGTAGAANTGSGGGGGCRANTTNSGGDGGSGVVILRYATSDVASYTATGLTPTEDTTTVPGQTILSFTTVGTGTITFTPSSTPTTTISTGEMIFNSTTDKVEYWDGTKWYGITYEVPAPPPALATSTVYLDASNNNSYPGTGSTWFDISGNSHNGAIYGAQFNTQGWFDFDGSNDIISIPHSSVLNAQTFSVGGWFYPEYTGGRWLFTKGGPSDWEYGASATTGTSAGIGFATWRYGGGQVQMTWTDASITANTWHHVIVTVDRVNVSAKLYVNGGAPKATDTSFIDHQTSSRPLLIGKRNDIGTYFDGRNSKFNFWSNQVLTQQEVQELYDAGH